MIENETTRLLAAYKDSKGVARSRFPVLPAYELALKCSHLFNVLDARGAISVTERAAMIGRVRNLATRSAEIWLDQSASRAASTAGASA